MTQAAQKLINLCEIKVGHEGDVFFCPPVGSCVIVTLYDSEKKIGGIAHCLLPERQGNLDDSGLEGLPGKYVVQAITALADWLVNRGAKRDQLKAKMTGGANVIEYEDPSDALSIGEKNIAAARKVLKNLQIPLEAQDVGGHYGRSVTFEVATGSIKVSSSKAGEKII